MKKIIKIASKIKQTKGFTLIELLLFMGIFSILTVMLFQLLLTIFDVELEAQSTTSVTQDARFILNRLAYDARNSTSITSPAVGSTANSLQLSNGTTTYTYSLSNGNLMLSNSTTGTSDQLNSINTSISGLSFLRLSDTQGKNVNTVTANFTVNSKVIRRSGTTSASFKTTIGIR